MATLRELIIKVSANSQSFQTEIARASRMGLIIIRQCRMAAAGCGFSSGNSPFYC